MKEFEPKGVGASLAPLWICHCSFTVCNSSCGKVMFSQVSVILSNGGGVHPPRQTPHLRQPPHLRQTPLQADSPYSDPPLADTPWADTTLGRYPRHTPSPLRRPPGQTPPGQTPPRQTPPFPTPAVSAYSIFVPNITIF